MAGRAWGGVGVLTPFTHPPSTRQASCAEGSITHPHHYLLSTAAAIATFHPRLKGIMGSRLCVLLPPVYITASRADVTSPSLGRLFGVSSGVVLRRLSLRVRAGEGHCGRLQGVAGDWRLSNPCPELASWRAVRRMERAWCHGFEFLPWREPAVFSRISSHHR